MPNGDELDKWDRIKKCRELLQTKGKKGTQKEIASVLGMSQKWVSKYDLEPTQTQRRAKR